MFYERADSNMFISLWLLLPAVRLTLCMDLTYYVEEGKNPGTFLGDIAFDSRLMDSIKREDRNLIRFSQLGQNAQLFQVNKKTGKLYTAQTLDAESLCTRNKECSQMVKVAVRRAKTFIKILSIRVIVQDMNDHQPEFPEDQVKIEFSEGDGIGMKKSIPNAVDRDIGIANSKLTYQLKKNMNDPFSLNILRSVDGTSKLSIVLEERIDRELKDAYVIQVIAKDDGSPPKLSVLDVHISVTDVNDNMPVFSQKIYNVSINYEHDATSHVAILSATDLDLGKNGRISYRFGSMTSDNDKIYFKLNKMTGEIFLHKKFTSGQKPTYKLYIEAADGGSPPLTSVVIVLVNVINQQNNAPVINVNFFSDSAEKTDAISEDAEVGSVIAYVLVTDPDIGSNGEVSCNLHHDKFQLQSLGTKEYKIIVKNALDQEIENHHDITICCQDKGSPPLSTESKFSIQVMDVNDVPPQFSQKSFKFWINENEKSKSPIGYINATDPDLGPGGKLTYSLITNKKYFLPFQIHDDGFISTVMSLDHEFQDIYKFQVFVKDNGVPSLNNTVDVSVEVRDANDNAPYFTLPSVNPYTLDFTYYPHHTKNITVLKASDHDSQENAFLKYEIISGNAKQLFAINHFSGLLSFRQVVTPQDSGSYHLKFVVRDSGNPVLSANVDIILKLTVSNKTMEPMSTKHMKSEKRINLVLMIVIVLVAVTVSVSITAAMSICIIRCKDRRHTSHQDEVMNTPCVCAADQGHYMCPSQHSNNWADVQLAGNLDSDQSRTPPRRSRRGQYPGGEHDHKIIDGPFQDIGGISRGKDNDYKQFMSADCNGEIGGDAQCSLKEQDLFTPQHFRTSSPTTEQKFHKGSLKKSKQQPHLYPNNISRPLYKPSIGHIPDCSQWIDLKPSLVDISDSHPHSRNLPEGKARTNGSHRIPSVPLVL